MILSGETIRKRDFIVPFYERTVCNGMSFGLGPAGYDVRLRQTLILKPGDFTLASIVEHITMPDDLVGYVFDKSTLARLGVSLFNTIVEPGWVGYLTLEVSHHGRNAVLLPAGSPIAQVVFHRTDKKCVGYDGKYQNQGKAPVGAKYDAE